jgi:putative endonuclease
MTAGRLKARAFGLALEWRAALWLTLKGYRVIARNVSLAGGEIDIVAVSPERWVGRGVVCFVEVRGRSDADAAALSVDEGKRRRIVKASEAFVRRTPAVQGRPIRFDIIAAGRAGGFRHVRSAFDP